MPTIIRQVSFYMAVYQWRVEAAYRCQEKVGICFLYLGAHFLLSGFVGITLQ